MVAYDARRPPDRSDLLRPETIEALRIALVDQRTQGTEPTPLLYSAIRSAAVEARERELFPEVLIYQLKQLADDAQLAPVSHVEGPRSVREWMVGACLRAYFESDNSP
jgi:hypothetical protein